MLQLLLYYLKYFAIFLCIPLIITGQASLVEIDNLDSLYSVGALQQTIDKSEQLLNTTLSNKNKAHVYQRKGQAYYKLNDREKAKVNFKKSLRLKLLEYDSTAIDIIKLYRNISICNNYLGQYNEAIIHLDTALILLNSSVEKDTSLWIQLYMQKSRILISNRDVAQANQYLRTALDLCKSTTDQQERNQLLIYELLTTNAIELQDAYHIKMWNDSTQHYLKKVRPYNEEDFLANIYNNKSLYFKLDEKKDSAIYYLSLAANLNRKNEPYRQDILAINYSNLSILYKDAGNYKKSLEYVNEALRIDKVLDNTSAIVTDLDNKASIYLKANEVLKAKQILQELMTYIDKNYESINKNAILSAYSTNVKIENSILESSGSNSEDVLQSAKRVTSFLDQLRSEYITDESKSFLIEDGRKIYDVIIKSYIESYKRNGDQQLLMETILLADNAKSLILLDAARHNKVNTELSRQEDEINRNISNLEIASTENETEKLENKNKILAAYEELKLVRETRKQKDQDLLFRDSLSVCLLYTSPSPRDRG